MGVITEPPEKNLLSLKDAGPASALSLGASLNPDRSRCSSRLSAVRISFSRSRTSNNRSGFRYPFLPATSRQILLIDSAPSANFFYYLVQRSPSTHLLGRLGKNLFGKMVISQYSAFDAAVLELFSLSLAHAFSDEVDKRGDRLLSVF